MSKSLARVLAAMQAHGVAGVPLEMPGETRTAVQAADAAGCVLDQIVKSIIFGGASGMYLFLTAGGNQVDPARASALAGETLGRADATQVRAVTGFAIGGVSPLGHLNPLPLWIDPTLLRYEVVWAAAGTPRHIFAIPPLQLQQITGAVVADFTA
ncbi:aminoacyl-tRNA deacylase [Cypionkella aquatica]|uniref:Aminoacyl-tRNA deacylase n=1 Tax=Cypionkella aquatica TaxID=1756042 RepID=A0AA37X2T8_9RHOB|nr:YbaK/EbsC family protein [Cypionkella aquatica]GLS87830.1 aminoacyl-tRNA deacylase [Cypionkella aquatica]